MRILFFIYIISSLTACRQSLDQPGLVATKKQWQQAILEKVHRYQPSTQRALAPLFTKQGLHYPPKSISLLAFKKEQKIELWANDATHDYRYIKDYPLTAFSGELGPKLKRNDRQIPEGVYHITHLNPYSKLHLSMMLDYPNRFDKQVASIEGRTGLGDNIFIHGKALSAGCLAVGDSAIDELFVLANRVGTRNVEVVIAPNDLRIGKAATPMYQKPRWVSRLYASVKQRLSHFKHRLQA